MGRSGLWATRWAPRVMRWCRGSAAFELGLAGTILDEGLHPDGAVPRGEQCGELLALQLQAGVEVDLEPAVDDLLGRAQGVRRRVRELGGPLHRLGVHLVGGDDLVRQADREGLVGLDEPAGEDEVLGTTRPDEAGEALRPA